MTEKQCIFHLIYERSQDSLWNGRPVFEYRNYLGRVMGRALQKDMHAAYDCVVPIPCTGSAYAEGVAEGLELPVLEALKKNTEDRFFAIKDREEREKYISECFETDTAALAGKNIVLVDEAIFTGATMKWVCAEMKKAGVKQIGIVIPTTEAASSCPYGVQPRRQMLLEKIPRTELAEYFGADELHFAGKAFFTDFSEKAGAACCECFS